MLSIGLLLSVEGRMDHDVAQNLDDVEKIVGVFLRSVQTEKLGLLRSTEGLYTKAQDIQRMAVH